MIGLFIICMVIIFNGYTVFLTGNWVRAEDALFKSNRLLTSLPL